MPHLNPSGVDLVNAAFIVHHRDHKVLLVDHRKLNGWYPPGGHVESNEDSDESIIREIQEETGLVIGGDAQFVRSGFNRRQFDVVDKLCTSENNNARAMQTPWLMDIHDFPGLPGHRHLALIYLVVAGTDQVQLEEAHREIRWFSAADLINRDENFNEVIRWYSLQAIKAIHGIYIPRTLRDVYNPEA